MRRFLLGMSGLFVLTGASAQFKVQGVPYDLPVNRRAYQADKQLLKAAFNDSFTMDHIEMWSGEGSNRAALAMQWNNGLETNALVWGYRWDGKGTGESMLRAIAKAETRFFIMSETGTAFGSTIAGIGYDANGDGAFSVVKNGEEFFPNEEGVIFVSGYNYDGFSPKDAADYWQSGWNSGYWSYWVKNSAADSWGYSGLGATTRELTNECWDGWNFAVNMNASEWLPLAAVEKPGPSVPRFNKHPESISADPGYTVTLSVGVGGTKPSLQWYKDNVAIKGANTKNLVLGDTKETDSGIYHCVATNDLGMAVSEKATVAIGEKTLSYAINTNQTVKVEADKRYAGFIGTLNIPATATIDGKSYPVTDIARDAFAGCDRIVSATLPASIQTIGNNAFKECTSLAEVAFGSEIRQIGDSAFLGCALLQEAVLPNTLIHIGKRAFVGCDELERLHLGNSIESVGEEAFYDCRKVTELTIPKTLTSIGMKSFSNMQGIKSVVYLPETDELPEYIFHNWRTLTTVELPATLKKIGKYAFYYCTSLHTVSMPEAIEEIGDYAFHSCSKLTALPLKQTKKIGQYAFNGCSLLAGFKLPETLESLGKYAFYNCKKLTEIVIPKGITNIGDNTFYGATALTSVRFEGAVTTFGNNVFQNCTSLTSFAVPASVTKLGNNTFKGCSMLEEVFFGDELKYLGTSSTNSNNMFENCKKLKKVVLGANLTAIGNYAFSGCAALQEIIYTSTTAPAVPGANAFKGVKNTCKVYVAGDLEETFKSTNYWKTLTIIGVDDPAPVYWIGEGENKATVAISWSDQKTPAIQLWGYRWKDTAPSAEEVIKQIVKADPRLFAVICPTLGAISGLGFDLNGKNTIAMIVSGNTTYPKYSDDGLFEATEANFREWIPADGEDHWNAPSKELSANWSCYLRNGLVGWSETEASLPAVTLKNGDCLNWVFDAAKWEDWKSIANFTATQPYVKKEIDYTNGFFVVNEDWFGWDNGTVNFVTDAYEIIYRAYRDENPGETFGVTTQFGTIYGDNFYFVSKQAHASGESADKGGRLVIADAKTLKKKASFEVINGGDGRSFLGVDPSIGYVATASGIELLNIPELKLIGSIEGTGEGSSYSGQIGNMERIGNQVFALKQSVGILVIDAVTHTVQHTISCPNASMMTLSKDGTVWVAVSGQNKLMAIDPVSLATKEISCPAGIKVSSSWGAWNAGNFCASAHENALYLATGGAFSLTTIVKYDIDKDLFTPDFFILPDQDKTNKQILYGAGVRVDPLTDQLVITTTEAGYGSHYQKNWIHMADAKTGKLIRTIVPENYYWFPAMPVFTDCYAPELNVPAQYEVQDQEMIIPLNTLVTDKDGQDAAIRVWASPGDWSVLSTEVAYPNLKLSGLTSGETDLTLKVESNGKVISQTIPVSVAVGTSLNDVEAIVEVSVYPNPAYGQVYVKAGMDNEVVISDLSGRCIESRIQKSPTEQFDLTGLPQGVYLVRIKDAENCRTLRFIKK
ncbi:MAG: leucine-rich repeat protein [Bacteroidales bacterium]